MAQKKVLVTGATGKIAGQIIPALAKEYELTLTDVKDTTASGDTVNDVQVTDLTLKDRDVYRHLFEGCDAVVHLGFVGNSNPYQSPSADDRFWHELSNIQMAYNVYQTSLEMGVSRVVVASSNHAADYYESLILDGEMDCVDPEQRALSNNYYGWAKESYEHLGFVFATGNQTTLQSPMQSDKSPTQAYQLENVQLRIGGPRETDIEDIEPGDLRKMRRALGVYLSERDMQQLVIKSIETEDIRDERGIPFQIFYGISANSHAFWSIANARKVIGYEPEDNSEIRFRASVAAHIEAAATSAQG